MDLHCFTHIDDDHIKGAQVAMEMLSNYGKSVGDITVYGNYPWNRFAQGVANVKIVVPEGAAVTEDGIEVYADWKSQLIFAE